MKIRLMAILLALAWAAPAQAMDVQGKWGFGVAASGLLGNPPDFTLLYGHSSSTAWLINVRFVGLNQNDKITGPGTASGSNSNTNQTALSIGPGLRRYMSPRADFSAYVDVTAFLTYLHAHQYAGSASGDSRSNGTTWGTSVGLDVGAEYFTRWHFSVAAHTGLASLAWNSTNNSSQAVGATTNGHSNSFNGGFGVSPALALRVYF